MRDMRHLWDGLYQGPAPPFIQQDNDLTYQLAAEWLDHLSWRVEDWGGGRGRAGKFFHHALYRVVDGSVTDDALYPILALPVMRADLQDYRSTVEGILLRHVLEHNHNWRQILANAVASFTRRMVIVIFTPFAKTTTQIATNWADIPDLSFNKDELLISLRRWLVKEESVVTDTQYKEETVFYFQKSWGGEK